MGKILIKNSIMVEAYELLNNDGKLVYAKTNLGLEYVLALLFIIGYTTVAYNKIKVSSIVDEDCNIIAIN